MFLTKKGLCCLVGISVIGTDAIATRFLQKRSPMPPRVRTRTLSELGSGNQPISDHILAENLLTEAKQTEQRYEELKKMEKKYQEKVLNNRVKHNALKYSSQSLARRLTRRYAWELRPEKLGAWRALKESFPYYCPDKKAMLRKSQAKMKTYGEIASESLSGGKQQDSLQDAFFKYGKYSSRWNALEDRSNSKASEIAHLYGQEADQRAKEWDRLRKLKSMEKGKFWSSEAEDYQDVENYQAKEAQKHSLNEYLKQDGIVENNTEKVPSTSTSGVQSREVYKQKAARHEEQHKHFQEAAMEAKEEADTNWLKYNAIKYVVPRFATRVANRYENTRDKGNAEYWYGKAHELEKGAFHVSDATYWEDRMRGCAPPHDLESLRGQRAARRYRELQRMRNYARDNNPLQALASAEDYRQLALQNEWEGRDSTMERKRVGGYMALADELEERKREEQANKQWERWVRSDNPYVSDVVKARGQALALISTVSFFHILI